MFDVHLVSSPDGDWQALYIDGACVIQDHSISARELCSALQEQGIIELTELEVPTDDRFPKTIDELHGTGEFL